jgi:Mrp family chromosome partitioning ATPase
MIKQFLEDVIWGELDYLIIDTPPGTSDEHISTVESLRDYNPDGAIIITTPQVNSQRSSHLVKEVSISDVRKEITFCRKINLPLLGIIENMSGYVCPHCAVKYCALKSLIFQECTNIFSSEGGKLLAQEQNIPFLGKIPIDPSLGSCAESGATFIQQFPDSPTLKTLQQLILKLEQNIQVNTK